MKKRRIYKYLFDLFSSLIFPFFLPSLAVSLTTELLPYVHAYQIKYPIKLPVLCCAALVLPTVE